MLEWLKKLFSRRDSGNTTTAETEPKLSTSLDPEDRAERQGMITRTCRECGKTFALPENVQHWPDYCPECRAKAPAQTVTRTCRGCGNEFTFPSTLRHWPNYCRDCQAKRKKRR